MAGQLSAKKRWSVRCSHETAELLGSGEFHHHQDFHHAAMKARMMNTFRAVWASQRVRLKSLSLEFSGGLDLRVSLGFDAKVPEGYTKIRSWIQVEADGIPEQFEKAYTAMQVTTPKLDNLSQAIEMESELEIL